MYSEPYIYLWFDRFLSVITFPINAFVLFVIVTKTPPEMKEYRRSLIILQSILLTLDVVLLSEKPEFYFPATAARMFGVWDSLLCLGGKNAMTTSTLLVMLVIAASNNIFVLKLQNLLDSSSRFKFESFGKAVILFPSNVLLPVLACVSDRLVPIEQGIETRNFLNMIEAHPSYSDLTNITDIYVGGWEPIYPPYVNFSAITMFSGVIVIFILEIVVKTHISIHGCYSILDNDSLHLSQKTKEMQKKFFRVLWLQVSNTLFSIGIPAIYSLTIILIQPNFIVQSLGLNNLFFAIAYCHGIIGSITILLLTYPYRLYVLSLIKKTRINGFLEKRFFNTSNKILSQFPSFIKERSTT